MKVGVEFRRNRLDMFQAIAPNAFFVFASTFPTNNAIANLLLGAPVTFYQGLGDFTRELSVWGTRRLRAGRMARRPPRDAELRPALRAHQPVHRGRGSAERVRARRAVDGAARCAARACSSPATRASAAASRRASTPSCRASASCGIRPARGKWSVRSSYGLFYDQFQNGSGTASQVAISSTAGGAVQPVQRRRAELPEPVSGPRVIRSRTRSCGRPRSLRSTRTRSRRTRRTGT